MTINMVAWAFKLYLFGLYTKLFAPPAVSLFAIEKNESQRGGVMIEMHNIYPWAHGDT